MIDRHRYGPVHAADGVVVGEGAVLGAPHEQRIRDLVPSVGAAVHIGRDAVLAHHVVVYEGARIGEACFIDDKVRIGYGCRIGDRTRITHGAYLGDRVDVGADCTLAGFICDGVRIGRSSSVMGRLVHEYTRPDLGWWGPDEIAPVIEHDTVVGFDAIVVGGVRVGPRSYVAAGAIVTRDVPPEHVVTGTNVMCPASEWTGVRLRPLIAAWTSRA